MVAQIGMQLAAQQSEQAGFARAIGTDQADLVAGIERDIDFVEKRLDAAHEGNLLKTDHVVCRRMTIAGLIRVLLQ